MWLQRVRKQGYQGSGSLATELIGSKYSRGSENPDKFPAGDDIPILCVQTWAIHEMVGRDEMVSDTCRVRPRRNFGDLCGRVGRHEGRKQNCGRDGRAH